MKLRLALLMVFFGLSVGCLDKCSDNPLTGPSSTSRKGGGPELWIAPNSGSEDFWKMFTDSGAAEWPNARASISTFQFYEGLVSQWSCGSFCRENNLGKFLEVKAFQRLSNEWGKRIALESGALKEGAHGCDQSIYNLSGNAIRAIGNIESGGGKVDYVSMDWPFASGEICGYSKEKSAGLIKGFIDLVHTAYPGVQVGLIEGYSSRTFEDLRGFIEAFESQGAHIPYVHYDYDRYGVQRPGPHKTNAGGYNPRRDLPMIRDYLRGKGIIFGVVVWGEDGDSSEGFASDAVLSSRQILNAVNGDVDRLVFQSWQGDIDKRFFPNNLPETKPGTLTWLVNTQGRR